MGRKGVVMGLHIVLEIRGGMVGCSYIGAGSLGKPRLKLSLVILLQLCASHRENSFT